MMNNKNNLISNSQNKNYYDELNNQNNLSIIQNELDNRKILKFFFIHEILVVGGSLDDQQIKVIPVLTNYSENIKMDRQNQYKGII